MTLLKASPGCRFRDFHCKSGSRSRSVEIPVGVADVEESCIRIARCRATSNLNQSKVEGAVEREMFDNSSACTLYLQAGPKGEVVLLHETLNRGLQVLNLVIELTLAVDENGASNDGTGDSTSESKCDLAGHKYIMHVLLFADQRQVQQDLKGLSIGGQDDQVSLLAIQGLGSCSNIRIV